MSVKISDSVHFTAALAGNPNCGKTTLFNACTRAKARTANWPGVTVAVESGEYRGAGISATVYDLPGIYDLASRSAEERTAQEFLTAGNMGTSHSGGKPGGIDVIINIADATALERSLYLTLRLIALGRPVVMALNMTDVLRSRGGRVDTVLLSHLLGIPVTEICARRGQGVAELMECAAKAVRDGESKRGGFSAVPAKTAPKSDAEVFALAEKIAARCISQPADTSRLTERADDLLCRPLTGVPILVLIMAAVFLLTFSIGDRLRGCLEWAIAEGIGWVEQAMRGSPPWVRELLCGAALPAVGAVIAFVPNLFILYLCLAVLDDSGYMSRAAFIADGAMARMSLSGKAFLPMLLGFGCSVPALLASRIVDGDKSRRRLAVAIPFIPCGARLPVCVMFAGMFFGEHPAFVCAAVYAFGVVMSFVVLKLTAGKFGQSRVDFYKCRKSRDLLISSGIHGVHAPSAKCRRECDFGKCKTCSASLSDYAPLIMEMPDFRSPGIRNVLTVAARKVGEYLKKAGTLIFLSSVALHFLISYGVTGAVASPADSFGASLGKLIAPILAPCGLGFWQIALALICAIGAKEMAVSSLTVLYGTFSLPALRLMLTSSGFTPASAAAFMVFTVLYIPCVSTLAVIRAEFDRQTALKSALISLTAAYAAAIATYQTASLFL